MKLLHLQDNSFIASSCLHAEHIRFVVCERGYVACNLLGGWVLLLICGLLDFILIVDLFVFFDRAGGLVTLCSDVFDRLQSLRYLLPRFLSILM
jgi:hypothetical protein